MRLPVVEKITMRLILALVDDADCFTNGEYSKNKIKETLETHKSLF